MMTQVRNVEQPVLRSRRHAANDQWRYLLQDPRCPPWRRQRHPQIPSQLRILLEYVTGLAAQFLRVLPVAISTSRVGGPTSMPASFASYSLQSEHLPTDCASNDIVRTHKNASTEEIRGPIRLVD